MTRALLLRLLPVVAVTAACWLAFIPLWPHYDFVVFWHAAREVLDGRTVYPPLGSPRVYDGHQFVYPYLAVVPFLPLGLLPVGVAYPVFLVLSCAATAVACWLLAPARALAPAIVLASSVSVVGLQTGALNALLMLAVALAWRYRHRPLVAGIALSVAIVAKLFLAPLGVWFLLSRRWAAAAVTAVVSLALLGVGFLVGPLGAAGYLRLLGELSGYESGNGWSARSLFVKLGAPDPVALALTVVVAAALVGLGVLGRRRGHDERLTYAVATLACLVVTPIAWAHYFVLLAVPLLVIGTRTAGLLGFAACSWAWILPYALMPDHTTVAKVLITVGGIVAGALCWRAELRADGAPVLGWIVAGSIGALFALRAPLPDGGAILPLVAAVAIAGYAWRRTRDAGTDLPAPARTDLVADRVS